MSGVTYRFNLFKTVCTVQLFPTLWCPSWSTWPCSRSTPADTCFHRTSPPHVEGSQRLAKNLSLSTLRRQRGRPSNLINAWGRTHAHPIPTWHQSWRQTLPPPTLPHRSTDTPSTVPHRTAAKLLGCPVTLPPNLLPAPSPANSLPAVPPP